MSSKRFNSPNIKPTGTISSPNTTPRSTPDSSVKKRRLNSPLYVQQTRSTPEILPKEKDAYITDESPNKSPGTKKKHLSSYAGRMIDSHEGVGKFYEKRITGSDPKDYWLKEIRTGGKKSRKNRRKTKKRRKSKRKRRKGKKSVKSRRK